MEESVIPHVLMLPLPLQGHLKPMLRLAELLGDAGFRITFVNSDYLNDLLHRATDVAAFYTRFPKFVFKSVPDGYPPDCPRGATELINSIGNVMKSEFIKLLVSMRDDKDLPSCIIADGTMMSVAGEAAAEVGIPVTAFRTYSACCTWTTFYFSELVARGQVPISAEDMDQPVPSFMSGLEGLLRLRDLHGICRIAHPNHPVLQFYIRETAAMARASALILNTVEEIESPFTTKLASVFPKIYTVGPLHGLLKSRLTSSPSEPYNGSLRGEERTCMTWLDAQPPRSVLYVSFGSAAVMSREQVVELWHGVVNSGTPFLWVTRDGAIKADDEIEGAGFVVSWAPQEEVLAHPATGGFLTHSGWNSTLESIHAGVPMICWPCFADQQVNSRCVSELWKAGVDMKDTCDRITVEKMVRQVMEDEKGEMRKSTDQIARVARDSVKEGGSSYDNLISLIQDIRSLAQLGPPSSHTLS